MGTIRKAMMQLVLSGPDEIMLEKFFKNSQQKERQELLQQMCVEICGTISQSLGVELTDSVELSYFSFGELDDPENKIVPAARQIEAQENLTNID